MSEWALRVGGPEDEDHVARCVYLAISWDGNPEIPPFEVARQHPELAKYSGEWGQPGDTVVIAEVGDEPVGYAFARFFTEDDHGAGFVDELTPEMGIAIEEGYRGAGVGTALLERLHDVLKADGIRQVSLSVAAANPARRLYDRLGYQEIGTDDDVRMLLRLD